MNIYIFSGRVMPERANVNISIPPLEVQAKDAGISGKATISVGASQVSIVFETADTRVDLPSLKNYIEYFVRVIVDAYGYLSGRGYDVEITSVVTPGGEHVVFGVGIRGLEEAEKERPLEFPNLLQVMYKSQELSRALGDLREAIRAPWDTGLFCFRAIECIRQSFRRQEDGDDQKPSWERLRTALRIDRSWIAELERLAVPQRHGETPYMSGKDRESAMCHAWRVIDRFCLYVHRDFKPLPENEFDMLK